MDRFGVPFLSGDMQQSCSFCSKHYFKKEALCSLQRAVLFVCQVFTVPANKGASAFGKLIATHFRNLDATGDSQTVSQVKLVSYGLHMSAESDIAG